MNPGFENFGTDEQTRRMILTCVSSEPIWLLARQHPTITDTLYKCDVEVLILRQTDILPALFVRPYYTAVVANR